MDYSLKLIMTFLNSINYIQLYYTKNQHNKRYLFKTEKNRLIIIYGRRKNNRFT